jgi:hypothetical protein
MTNLSQEPDSTKAATCGLFCAGKQRFFSRPKAIQSCTTIGQNCAAPEGKIHGAKNRRAQDENHCSFFIAAVPEQASRRAGGKWRGLK